MRYALLLYTYKDLRRWSLNMVNQTERYFLYDSALYGKDISRKLNDMEEKCYFSRSPA